MKKLIIVLSMLLFTSICFSQDDDYTGVDIPESLQGLWYVYGISYDKGVTIKDIDPAKLLVNVKSNYMINTDFTRSIPINIKPIGDMYLIAFKNKSKFWLISNLTKKNWIMIQVVTIKPMKEISRIVINIVKVPKFKVRKLNIDPRDY
jgi:hypothetical protein